MGGATATGREHVTVQRIVPIAAERAFARVAAETGGRGNCQITRLMCAGYCEDMGHIAAITPRKNVRDAGSRRVEFPGCNASSHARAPLN